jgi:hypothetical protein
VVTEMGCDKLLVLLLRSAAFACRPAAQPDVFSINLRAAPFTLHYEDIHRLLL